MEKKIFILIILLSIVFCVLAYFVELPICYDSFPADLRRILRQRVAELKSEGSICIAGRVKMSDGAHISGGEDVMVNLYHGIDSPLWVYDGGWFIMCRTASSSYAGADKGFVLRAFGYEPIDASITILQGKITYVEFVMQKTSPEGLSSVSGIVTDSRNKPFDGANVSLKFPFANHGRRKTGYTYPHMEMTTGQDGRYWFEGLSAAEHSVVASASGYAYHYRVFSPAAGEIANEDLKLYPNRSIVIDYVYQADGSRDFIGGDLRAGTIEWVVGRDGIDFSDGKVEGYEIPSTRDIEMRQKQGVLQFYVFYCNGQQNGLYDAGAVDFKSVTEAAQAGYSTETRPCVVGHTYIVQTYENSYAKFVVRSISE